MDKTYNPQDFEKDIYNRWMRKKYFSSKPNKDKKKFSISMPPLNVTGRAHMGHALNNTIQDALIRQKRMQGYEALWLPGTDHAAIATEEVLVRALKAEGHTKESLGREEFLRRGEEWYAKYRHVIGDQLKTMGVSCDWDREAFTMDDNLSQAVRHVFVEYYKKGYIYRGKRVVNYCPSCKTTISDNENIYHEQSTNLWHIRYPFVDGNDGIIIATTRPETMFGDTAVAVNPRDKRYKKLIGKELYLPLTKRKIKLIADDYCEMDFGTGAVKITPAHDPNDYEIGLRHNLEVISCIGDDGKLTEAAGQFAGLDRTAARKPIEEALKKGGYLVKIEKYNHKVGSCERCDTITEPKISTQWFVKMNELAKPAIEVVKKGDVKFVPKKYEKQYLNWLENIKDWCISRQIWLGHRIPVFYCQDCDEIIVSDEDPTECSKCHSKNLVQDSDVLDTWFSSALWPFSTLGYPQKTKELAYYYPTDVLVTGYDIITFWVTKMVFSSMDLLGKIPFSNVLINGIVRDAKGIKMSKHLGNGIDPIELIDKYGADSMRFSLILGMSMGTDIKYSEDKTKEAKVFINKIWNASQFVLHYTKGIQIKSIDSIRLNTVDKWILSELNALIKENLKKSNKFELGNVATNLFEFFWGKFCDWYIEMSKVSADKESTASVLCYVLETLLKLLHPLMPFVTEKIYLELPNHGESIMIQSYPEYSAKMNFAADRKRMEEIIDIIKKIRAVRADMNVPDNKKTSLFILPLKNERTVKENARIIEKLSNCKDVKLITADKEIKEECTVCINPTVKVFLPSSNLIDTKQEIERLTRELETIESEIKRAAGKLVNAGFVDKAPKELITAEKEKLRKYEALKKTVSDSLTKLKR